MSISPSPETLDVIKRLIALDTTSRDSNLELIGQVSEALAAHGIEPVLIHNEDGRKANLLATFPAADGSTTGGIVLSAHTDVVPVDGQQWQSDPFTATVRDDRLYGRGTCDMKSFLGAVVAYFPAFAAAQLREPIHIAFSYDEEVGCVGAVSLVEKITELGLEPRGCIVGEPSSMRAIRGHKSVNVFRVDFRGVAAHSSLTTEGVNAIAYAARFTSFVHELAAEFAKQGPFDPAYLVPYTSTTVNQIAGGIAVNTIPADCQLHFEFRSIAATDQQALIERFRAKAEELNQQMRQANEQAGVEFTVIASSPGLETDAGSRIVSDTAAWGALPCEDKVTYGTEAGLFANAGIATVVCGPGDIAQAHAPDEFIELEQIAHCEQMLDAMLASLSQ
ncbi:acetylornithine deacetylase [Glutamicibacter endophyticus]|uniref:acetylornithine deacetylase n=1 Tax=Glutamicibacter endophyticus TaxID=1522174 RepID=UPI003AF1B2DF